MPELFWYKRFPQDWMSDPKLGRCSPASRGIWADIIENCYLTNSPRLTGNTGELSRVCRCSEGDFTSAIAELKRQDVGIFRMQDGMHIIECRRLLRSHAMKDLKVKAANTRWCKHDAHAYAQVDAQAMQTPMQVSTKSTHANTHAPSASASEYASVSASKGERGRGEFDSISGTITKWFERKPTQILSYMEESTIFELSRRPDIREEIQEIDQFRRKRGSYFPRSLEALLTQWDKTLDRSRTHDDSNLNNSAKPPEKSLMMKIAESL